MWFRRDLLGQRDQKGNPYPTEVPVTGRKQVRLILVSGIGVLTETVTRQG